MIMMKHSHLQLLILLLGTWVSRALGRPVSKDMGRSLNQQTDVAPVPIQPHTSAKESDAPETISFVRTASELNEALDNLTTHIEIQFNMHLMALLIPENTRSIRVRFGTEYKPRICAYQCSLLRPSSCMSCGLACAMPSLLFSQRSFLQGNCVQTQETVSAFQHPSGTAPLHSVSPDQCILVVAQPLRVQAQLWIDGLYFRTQLRESDEVGFSIEVQQGGEAFLTNVVLQGSGPEDAICGSACGLDVLGGTVYAEGTHFTLVPYALVHFVHTVYAGQYTPGHTRCCQDTQGH